MAVLLAATLLLGQVDGYEAYAHTIEREQAALAGLDYLVMADAERPEPLPTFAATVMARVACIEAKESGGANVPNHQGSGAGGVMQYMESTFRAHAAELGHPEWSRWVPEQARLVAAHDLLLGRRAQWTVSGC